MKNVTFSHFTAEVALVTSKQGPWVPKGMSPIFLDPELVLGWLVKICYLANINFELNGKEATVNKALDDSMYPG
jgi:hypothetical protein